MTIESQYHRVPVWSFCAAALVLVLCYSMRSQSVERDMTGSHAWKNIRHYQFAADMLRTGNPLFAAANFNQPEVWPQWSARLTEAPLVDWLLVGVFATFGQSPHNHYLTFVIVALLTHLLAFVLLRRQIGDFLALLAVLTFALTPLCAYFAGHSIGENLLYSAQLLYLVACVRCFASGFSRGNLLLVLAACVYLFMCKFTSGFIMGATGFVAIGSFAAFSHRQTVAGWIRQHRALTLTIVVVTVVLGTAGLLKFASLMDKYLAISQTKLFDPEFYRYISNRWWDHIGVYLFVIAAVNALALLVLRGIAMGRSGAGRFTPFERGLGCLWLITLASFAVQSPAFVGHEYYSTTFVIPLILLSLTIPARLEHSRRVGLLAFLIVVYAAAFIVDWRSNHAYLRWFFHQENIHADDRAALKRFFLYKKEKRDRYFIYARQPFWAYFSGTLMDMRYEWPDVICAMEKTPVNIQRMRDLGLRYVVYPISVIPPDVRETLEHEVLLDLGPNHFKLGIVHRGERFYIFKITEGISYRQRIDAATPSEDPATGWVQAGQAFVPTPNEAVTGGTMLSDAPGVGVLSSHPFEAIGETIVYYVRGGNWPGIRVDLERYGEVIDRQHPADADMLELRAVSLAGLYKAPVVLKVVDSYTYDGAMIEVGGFEQVSFAEPDLGASP